MDIQELKETLPHGSGINGDWKVKDMGRYFRASNIFEPLNDAGFYDGTVYFYLTIPKKDTGNFKLHFTGSDYLAKKYQLRAYIEDTVANCLSIEKATALAGEAKNL